METKQSSQSLPRCCRSKAQSWDHRILLDNIFNAIASRRITSNCKDHQVPTFFGFCDQFLHILLSESVVVFYYFLHANSALRSICKKVLAIAHAVRECEDIHLGRLFWLWDLKNVLWAGCTPADKGRNDWGKKAERCRKGEKIHIYTPED